MRPLAIVALVVAAPVLQAQATPKRLPPNQHWGTGSGPARKPAPAVPVQPEQPQAERPDRPDHPDRDRDRDRDGHRRGPRHGFPHGASLGFRHPWAEGAGLQARLWAPELGRMRFALSDRAYVAVFELQPGRGVRLVFPDDWAAERPLAPGFHEPLRPAGGDAVAAQATRAEGPVRYLYLVASDAPLGLAPAKRAVGALQRLMGPMAFQSQSTWEITNALKTRVLTLGAPGTWDEEIVAWRPGIDDVANTNRGVASVRCGNGVLYAVEAGERFECPR